MKKSKLVLLIFTVVFVYSCSKDENLKTNEVNSFKKVDMSNVGDNYDKLVLDIQSNPNLDIVIGDYNFELRGMKPAEGISVENTIIFEDDRHDRTIIIDGNTESIYVRYTDNDKKYRYTLYGFKNPDQLKEELKSESYNIDKLMNKKSYRNRLNKSAKLESKYTETSFLIGKPILTKKAELLEAQINDNNQIKCDFQKEEEKPKQQVTKSRLIKRSNRKRWNVVIYKRYNNISTSAIVDALISTFKSLSSIDGSNWFYSTTMYANLNVTYKDAPNSIYSDDSTECLKNFADFLEDENIPNNRSSHSYMYLTNTSWFKGHLGLANSYKLGYRVGISTNNSTTFAHELGHTLGADHFFDAVWDSSLGWFGWWGNSVMCQSGYSNWYAGRKDKYYSSSNRNIVRSVLN